MVEELAVVLVVEVVEAFVLVVEELLVDVELVGGTLPTVVKSAGVTSVCSATLS
jgi:hypothetical protein